MNADTDLVQEMRDALAEARELARRADQLAERLSALTARASQLPEQYGNISAADAARQTLQKLINSNQAQLADRHTDATVLGGGVIIGWLDASQETAWLHPRTTLNALTNALAPQQAPPSTHALGRALLATGALQRSRSDARTQRTTIAVRLGGNKGARDRTRDVWEIDAEWLLQGDSYSPKSASTPTNPAPIAITARTNNGKPT